MLRVKRFFTVSSFTLLFSYIMLMLTGERTVTAAFIVCVIFTIIYSAIKSLYAKHMLIISAFIALSLLMFSLNEYSVRYALRFTGEDKLVYGTVSACSDNYILLKDATCEDKIILGKINIYTENEIALSSGDKISIELNELFSTASDGLYHYHTLSERDYLTAFADEKTITVHSSHRPWFIIFSELKENTEKRFFNNLPSEKAGIVTALITGDKSTFSSELKNSLKYSGAAHIFAVSGMHLSIWTSLFFIFFKRRARSKFLPNAAAMLFVAFYCIFTGFSPSVLRSGIMLLSVFAAKLIKKQADSLNSLGLAGTVLLISNPFLAGNISFLLSFIATFSMIFFTDYIIPEISYKRILPTFIKKRISGVISAFAISLAVIISTIPVTSLFFGYVSLLSPLSSLLMTPFVQGAMITGTLAAVLPDISVISSFLWKIAEFFTDVILYICNCFTDTDIAIQPSPAKLIIPWFIVSFFVTAFVFMKYKNRTKTFCSVAACVLILCILTATINTINKDNITIYIPENVNGTSISVVKQSAHKSAIFGCGGTYTTAEETVKRLNSQGILKADYLFIPRSTATESNNSQFISNSLLPRNIITLYDEKYTQQSTIPLWKDTRLSSDVSSDNAVALLETDGIKTVICTLPSCDISLWDEKYLSGDIFITRNAIPENLDTNNFSAVIIMTDRQSLRLPDNAYSTADGGITITVKGDHYGIHR